MLPAEQVASLTGKEAPPTPHRMPMELAARAQEWRTRGDTPGTTWAGLWHPDLQSQVDQLVVEHAFHVDSDTITRLERAGVLPGVRDYSPLVALVMSEEEKETCVDGTT